MENAEEVMQLLEDFSKIRPKEIPPELEDYLGYVATTGDPVFQWTLVKSLFREKLLSVITDFFESTLTVELPPCPNVEPFNYERMKTCLLERLDTFTSAPFTIQRICELLTNPRKEYNRADKYMRAIEKNILVVSTREPGSGKRPLECDSQQETILNGMPDVKLNVGLSDGSLLHVPTDLPYLGAPPASIDVTIETTEANIGLSDVKENPDVSSDDDSKHNTVKADADKPDQPMPETTQSNQESEMGLSLPSSNDTPGLLIIESLGSESTSTSNVRSTFDCDTNDKLSSLDDVSSRPLNIDSISDKYEDKTNSEISAGPSNSDLPDSLDSSDSLQNKADVVPLCRPTTVLDCHEAVSISDENEVSSTPAETSQVGSDNSVSEDLEEPTDSEAEATDSIGITLDGPSENSSMPCTVLTAETSGVDRSDEIKSIAVTEVSATKPDDASLECDEISGTVVSPISPNNLLSQADENVVVPIQNLDPNDQEGSHPDSSNDACLNTTEYLKVPIVESEIKTLLDSSSEADSMSEAKPILVDLLSADSNSSETVPDQTVNECLSVSAEQVSSPATIHSSEDKLDHNLPMSSTLDSEEGVVSQGQDSEEVVVTEGQSLVTRTEESIKVEEVQSTSDTQSEEMTLNQDKREESVIHSTLQHESAIVHKEMLTSEEEISIDPNCEAEEAMDVDDTSNQMLVSEGENESEPMDESDQVQS